MKSRAKVADRLRANFAADVKKSVAVGKRCGLHPELLDSHAILNVCNLIGRIEAYEPELAKALAHLIGRDSLIEKKPGGAL
ncbi:hypothetical protein [Burkholderia gladioli]|uniref:hypothetical protein n=1 Tax=Burkholderia gladioli TaxID=28095 RepID=UPI001641D49B|nr:hypothetical protein [Burkholderia gladioli]